MHALHWQTIRFKFPSLRLFSFSPHVFLMLCPLFFHYISLFVVQVLCCASRSILLTLSSSFSEAQTFKFAQLTGLGSALKLLSRCILG